MKTVSVLGSNGMLSEFITKTFIQNLYNVNVYGLDVPINYSYTNFYHTNLLTDEIDFNKIIKSDIIVYAAGAGVQAALKTDPLLMYKLNVDIPIKMTLQLKKYDYKGIYISFGSYMEIGLNDERDKAFTEDDIIYSKLPVTNDYALSKRLYGRYIKDLICNYTYWHFILPNMFSYNDFKPGTRLIPYILKYIQDFKAGKNIENPKFSAGIQKRQFILMEEISNILLKSIFTKMPSGIYNVAGGEYMSIRNLIEKIFKYYNVPCLDEYFGREKHRDGDIKSLKISGDKLFSAIHYLPLTKIEDILNK